MGGDQDRLKEDKRSGITNDPNRKGGAKDDVLNLIGQMITVSLATVDLVDLIGAEELP